MKSQRKVDGFARDTPYSQSRPSCPLCQLGISAIAHLNDCLPWEPWWIQCPKKTWWKTGEHVLTNMEDPFLSSHFLFGKGFLMVKPTVVDSCPNLWMQCPGWNGVLGKTISTHFLALKHTMLILEYTADWWCQPHWKKGWAGFIQLGQSSQLCCPQK